MGDRKVFSFISAGSAQTIAAGRLLGACLTPGCVICLTGELGAGKTCFIKGIAEGLNGTPAEEVTSPTFTILQEYPGPVPLYHFDAYRLSGPEDLEAIGFEEYIGGAGVAVIEWADRIEAALPPERIGIEITWVSENERSFTCAARGRRSRDVLSSFFENLGALREPDRGARS
jgi:tRNA threonylcarbamoyladenosine biosynthesis protein TsaE